MIVKTIAGLYCLIEGYSSTIEAPKVSMHPITVETDTKTTRQNSSPDQSQLSSMPAREDSARVSPINQKSLPISPTVSSPLISCFKTKSCFSSATPNKENTKRTERIVQTK